MFDGIVARAVESVVPRGNASATRPHDEFRGEDDVARRELRMREFFQQNAESRFAKQSAWLTHRGEWHDGRACEVDVVIAD